MEQQGADVITTKLALAWATLPPDRRPSWSMRLTDVRCFARHLVHIDPRTEVPPVRLLPPIRRAKPYIYSATEISALLTAALQLPPTQGLRRWTYHCFFGLIAAAGLRHAEALHLRRKDVDIEEGILTVRGDRVRQVPPRAAASDDDRRPGQLRRTAGRPRSRTASSLSICRVASRPKSMSIRVQRPPVPR
jgi:integrase